MKIWDLPPGFLNASALWVEHRELHAIAQHKEQAAAPILISGAPVSLRAACWRHELVAEEFWVRRLEHKSPLPFAKNGLVLNSSQSFSRQSLVVQLEQLRALADDMRIPAIFEPEQALRQFAFSLMARDLKYYQWLHAEVRAARMPLNRLLVEVQQVMRAPAKRALWLKVIQSMWRICEQAPEARLYISGSNQPRRRLKAMQYLAEKYRWPALWQSTALTDLAVCEVQD